MPALLGCIRTDSELGGMAPTETSPGEEFIPQQSRETSWKQFQSSTCEQYVLVLSLSDFTSENEFHPGARPKPPLVGCEAQFKQSDVISCLKPSF